MKELFYILGLIIVLIVFAFFRGHSNDRKDKSNPSVVYLLKGGHTFIVNYESYERAAKDYEKVKKAFNDCFASKDTCYTEYVTDSLKTKTMVPFAEISALRLIE